MAITADPKITIQYDETGAVKVRSNMNEVDRIQARLAKSIEKANFEASYREAAEASDDFRRAQERLAAAAAKAGDANKSSVREVLSFGFGAVTAANQALEFAGKIGRITGALFDFARAGAEAAGVGDDFARMDESLAGLEKSAQAAVAQLLSATGAVKGITVAADLAGIAVDALGEGIEAAGDAASSTLSTVVEWAASIAGIEPVSRSSNTALNDLVNTFVRMQRQAADNLLDKEAERISAIGAAAQRAKTALDAGLGDPEWAAQLVAGAAGAGQLADDLRALNPRIEELSAKEAELAKIRENVNAYQADGNKLTFDEMAGLQRLEDDLKSVQGELLSLRQASDAGGAVLAEWGEQNAKAAPKVQKTNTALRSLIDSLYAGVDAVTRFDSFVGDGIASFGDTLASVVLPNFDNLGAQWLAVAEVVGGVFESSASVWAEGADYFVDGMDKAAKAAKATRQAQAGLALDTVNAIGSMTAEYLGGGWAKAGFEAAFQVGMGLAELSSPPLFGANRFAAATQLLLAQAFAESNGGKGGGSGGSSRASAAPAAAGAALLARPESRTSAQDTRPVVLVVRNRVLAETTADDFEESARYGGRKLPASAVGSGGGKRGF